MRLWYYVFMIDWDWNEDKSMGHVDASDLFLAPGEWPKTLIVDTVVPGEGIMPVYETFTRLGDWTLDPNGDYVDYVSGDLTLRVFND